MSEIDVPCRYEMPLGKDAKRDFSRTVILNELEMTLILVIQRMG